jgi:hypothetical protein
MQTAAAPAAAVPQIIAASVLIMNEAQELVAMAEPAWQYDTYNKIWMLMADHYELEERLQNLTAKVRKYIK